MLAEVTVEDFVDGRGEDARAVKRVKFKLHDKRAALVDLGRHLGMFDAKHKQPDASRRAATGEIHPDPPVARRRELLIAGANMLDYMVGSKLW